MPVYNIYLVDITNRIGSDDRRERRSKAALQSYFDPIAKKAGVKEGANVQFVTEDPQAKDNELHRVLLDIRLACRHRNGRRARVPAPSEGGLTYWNGKVTGSDVVADGDSETRTIANLTFHELMHNKLKMGDEMHSLGGLAVSVVDSSLRPSTGNVARMSAALLTKRPQWTGGFEQLRNRGKPVKV